MAVTLYQGEAQDSFPGAPEGLSDAAAALDSDAIWQRLEAFIAYRWSEREVIWIAEGPGEWAAPLSPIATLTATEHWTGQAYAAADPPAGPLGGLVLEDGIYRITAQVGAAPVPANAAEAFRRLAEYLAASDEGAPGASSLSVNIGPLSENIRRNPAHIARAIHNSGAADLLRKYRRA